MVTLIFNYFSAAVIFALATFSAAVIKRTRDDKQHSMSDRLELAKPANAYRFEYRQRGKVSYFFICIAEICVQIRPKIHFIAIKKNYFVELPNQELKILEQLSLAFRRQNYCFINILQV